MAEHDCQDYGCWYAKNKTGMRTQGGKCRCMERADREIAVLREVLEGLVDATEGIRDFGGEPLVRDKAHYAAELAKANACIERAYEVLTTKGMT